MYAIPCFTKGGFVCYNDGVKEKRGDLMRLQFQKGDYFAIGLVVILAVAVALAYLPGFFTEPAAVEIYQDGMLIKTMDLSADASFTFEGTYTNVITIEDGRVSITHSDCPGMDCVHSGSISSVGRSLACLPNGLEVRVVGNDGDVDFVVG